MFVTAQNSSNVICNTMYNFICQCNNRQYAKCALVTSKTHSIRSSMHHSTIEPQLSTHQQWWIYKIFTVPAKKMFPHENARNSMGHRVLECHFSIWRKIKKTYWLMCSVALMLRSDEALAPHSDFDLGKELLRYATGATTYEWHATIIKGATCTQHLKTRNQILHYWTPVIVWAEKSMCAWKKLQNKVKVWTYHTYPDLNQFRDLGMQLIYVIYKVAFNFANSNLFPLSGERN